MALPASSPVYRMKRANILTNPVTTAVVFNQFDKSTWATYVALPFYDTNTSAARFRLRAHGRATTGGNYTFVAKIQYQADISTPAQLVSALTITNNTDFVTLTSQSISTATRPWFLDCDVVWDSTSQRLTGIQQGFNSETVGPASTAITALTGVNLQTGKVGFVINAVFGTTNAANIAYLDSFVVEAV